MLPSYISPEDSTLLLLSHECFTLNHTVFSMYILVCTCAHGTCVKEIETVCTADRDSSVPLLFHLFIIAVLLCMIANSCEFPRKGGESVYEWRLRGEKKSKQMDKCWLWPHLQGDLCTQHADICFRALLSNGIPDPIFVSPVSPHTP